MTVDVIVILSEDGSHLANMVNLKSLKNYKNLLKVDQYIIFGKQRCKVSFKRTTLKDLYKYQFSYEHFIEVSIILEENLQYKTKNTQTNNVLKEVVKNLENLKINSIHPNTKWLGEEYRVGLDDAITEITKLIK